MFSEKDLTQIQKRGSDLGKVKQQIARFETGFPFLNVKHAATTPDGIRLLSEAEKAQAIDFFDQNKKGLSMLKFVPASGAASRMFKDLFAFRETLRKTDENPDHLLSTSEFQSVKVYFDQIEKFAFYRDLIDTLSDQGIAIENLSGKDRYLALLDGLLDQDGLNYGNLPKGLLKFHKYKNSSRTPVEEHLVEGALYARNDERTVQLHFTVSPEHRQKFIQHILQVQARLEKAFHVQYDITFSEQRASTDTIAVDMQNEPFREPDGSLLFRPAGHGALLENLGELSCDLVFIKNIDNVVPDRIKKETVDYKKALAGKLLSLQAISFGFLEQLESWKVEDRVIADIRAFLANKLNIQNLPEFDDKREEIAFLRSKLHRPIRVCGMVKNEGEPGGGPFFALHPDGTHQLQIAESSQIDPGDENQIQCLAESTHFNPVDLVCSFVDYRGQKFDLRNFVDPDTGFISEKSKDGKSLKAQELPGLWNGSMANWNTVFVEVPVSTFNPVKTVNDLLRDAHQ